MLKFPLFPCLKESKQISGMMQSTIEDRKLLRIETSQAQIRLPSLHTWLLHNLVYFYNIGRKVNF